MPEFLRKLFPGRPVPPEVARGIEELTRLARERPALAGPATLLADILPVLYETPAVEVPPVLDAATAEAKSSSGVPLLRGETVEIDRSSFLRRWQAICAAVARHRDGTDALRRARLDFDLLIQEVLAGRPDSVHAHADTLGLDAALTATVLRLALFPSLARLATALLPLRQGGRWDHGHCPVCGSWPLLGEFRGLEQTHFLRCGLCASEWEFPRLRCPFCANADHRTLGYFHTEGEEVQWRARTCDTCRAYVKTAFTIVALTPPRLLTADVATLHLDLVAAARGYVVPCRAQL